MSTGYALGGRILTVDLSTGSVTYEPTQPYSDRLLGGLGINVLKILEMTPVTAGPFDEHNPIAFGAGTLVGTLAPTACRVVINSKNFFSNGFGSASAGGFFTAALKYAGFDNLVVTGKAARPVYLLIQDDRVSIEDAGFLWGRSTWDAEKRIREKLNDPHLEILSIGPAGENQVGAANIVVSRSRSASRCGLGAVMGSKNLKAIAVSGSGGIRVADPEGFVEACREMSRRIVKADTTVSLRKYGTPTSFARWNEQSALPTLNFQKTQMDLDKAAGLGKDILKDEFIRRAFGCFACPLHCSQFLEIRQGPYAGMPGEKIECQNLWDFGTKLGFDNLAAVIKASALCFELGLDINNASGAISWAIECFQRGILTEADTDGLVLKWGDSDTVLTLLKKMAFQTGFGALLAKGSREAARIIGRNAEEYAIHVRGQELAEELRAFKGWALGITVAERGGAHTSGAPLTERMTIDADLSCELFGIPTASQPDTYAGKAQLVVYYQQFHALLEALGVCFFSSNWMGPHMARPEDYAVLHRLATGRSLDAPALMEIGEKIHVLCKLYNLKHAGGRREDDFPPERLMNEPSTGTEPGKKLDREDWSRMLDEYYNLHGWDLKTGHPTRERLVELGLDDVVL